MTNNLLCCFVLVWLLSSAASLIHAEDSEYGTKKQPSATKFPPPAYNTSSTSSIKDDDLATYCVAKSFGANMESMAGALSWCCGIIDCSLLQPGKECFEPDSLAAHASYAFNLYYQKSHRMKGSCDFNGTAMVTTTEPSHGACIFRADYPGPTSSASRLQHLLHLIILSLLGVVLVI